MHHHYKCRIILFLNVDQWNGFIISNSDQHVTIVVDNKEGLQLVCTLIYASNSEIE